MNYTYRNKKTGEQIVTSNKVTGKNWEPAEENLYSAEGMEDDYEDILNEDPAEEAGEDCSCGGGASCEAQDLPQG